MPSKIQLDENLWFLFICLQKSDYKAIDFNAVGEATNLKPPAARMRYTRLRRQIEGGTLIGTQGIPFTGAAEKIAEAKKKPRGKSGHFGIHPVVTHDIQESAVKRKIKSEVCGPDDNYSTTSCSDSEDEIPLAKLRAQKTMASHRSRGNSWVSLALRKATSLTDAVQDNTTSVSPKIQRVSLEQPQMIYRETSQLPPARLAGAVPAENFATKSETCFKTEEAPYDNWNLDSPENVSYATRVLKAEDSGSEHEDMLVCKIEDNLGN